MLSVLSLIKTIFLKTFMGDSPPRPSSWQISEHLQPPVAQGFAEFSLLVRVSDYEAYGRGTELVGVKFSRPLAVKASVLGVLKRHLSVRWSGTDL